MTERKGQSAGWRTDPFFVMDFVKKWENSLDYPTLSDILKEVKLNPGSSYV